MFDNFPNEHQRCTYLHATTKTIF